MIFKKAVLILGYNNTRVNDVKTIRIKAMQHLSAVTVLCKKFPTTEDKLAVDYVIDVGLEGTNKNIKKVMETLKIYKLSIIALLPFSDPGTQLGAALAKELKLRGADINKVVAALDKYTFRSFEKVSEDAPKFYKKVRSEVVNSLEHLISIYHNLHGKVFLKPAKEGNSRGCINLNTENNLKAAWNQVEPYLAGGIVAEELILNANEYSWDYVSGFSWITEKKQHKINIVPNINK